MELRREIRCLSEVRMSDTLLEIRHLNIEFHDHDKPESVVNDFNLTLQPVSYTHLTLPTT